MALRDKLKSRTQPYLDEGERIEHIFPAQYGTSPWVFSLGGAFGALGALLLLAFAKPRIVAVTDKSLIMLTAGKWFPTKPKAMLGRMPLDTPVSAPKGKLWGKTEIGGWKFYVHRRFFKDVRAAFPNAS